MKKSTIILVCLLIFLSLNVSSQAFNLTVTITNLKSKNGMVEVGLYRNAETFAKVGLTYKQIRTKINNNQVTVIFHALEKGNYGVCVYHDENNNKSCDRNFFGFPTEQYGFSNNIRPKLSAPSFEKCTIKLDKNKTITIKTNL